MMNKQTLETVSKTAIVGAVTTGVAVLAFSAVALPLHWLGVPDGYSVAAGCLALRACEKLIKGIGAFGLMTAGATMDTKYDSKKLAANTVIGLGLGATSTLIGAFFLGSALTKNSSDIETKVNVEPTTQSQTSFAAPQKKIFTIS